QRRAQHHERQPGRPHRPHRRPARVERRQARVATRQPVARVEHQPPHTRRPRDHIADARRHRGRLVPHRPGHRRLRHPGERLLHPHRVPEVAAERLHAFRDLARTGETTHLMTLGRQPARDGTALGARGAEHQDPHASESTADARIRSMKRFLAIFKDRPVEGDLLTALLSPLRLRGVFHSRWTARAPWGVAGEREDCALLHHVQEGTCLVLLPDRTLRLGPGDLAVFPHGSAHVLADAPGRVTVPLADLLPAREPGAIGTVRIDGPGPETTLLCGGLHYDASAATPLYRALPRVLVLPADVVAGQPLLRETLTRLAGEWDLAEPGLGLVALRGFELAYVLALRAALATLDAEPVLAALRHPAVAPALLAIHSR